MFEKMEEALKTKTPEQELNILLDSLRVSVAKPSSALEAPARRGST